MDEATAKTIEKIQTRIQLREQQSLADKRLINQLCEIEGEPPMYGEPALASQEANTVMTAVRSDQFFGRPMATVVREILERRTQKLGAIPLNDLFELMKAGGFQFENKDEAIAKRSVTITIGKNPAFVRVPNSGHIGLAEWYPGAKEKKPKNGDAPKDEPSSTGATQFSGEKTDDKPGDTSVLKSPALDLNMDPSTGKKSDEK